MNLASWLIRSGLSRAHHPALLKGTRTVATYARLAERVAALAGGLRGRLGLAEGDRVALFAPNSPHYLEIMFAAWHAGLVVVPVNAKLHGAEAGWIIENAGARLVFAGEKEATALSTQSLSGVTGILIPGSPDYEVHCAGEMLPMVPRAADDLAWLFYTSGTTGRPKGAMLTHRNLAAMSLAYLAEVDPTDETGTLLHAAPMSHGSGMYMMAHVLAGAANAVTESGGFETDEVLTFMQDRPGTSMFAAPTMIRRLVEVERTLPPGAIRTIIWGGAPMHVADIRAALDRFGPCFAQIYGQGETPMTGTVLTKRDVADREHPRWLARIGSAGRVSPAVEIMVADESDQPVPTGEAGEILVRGDTVMAGYWKNPEASASALKNGWLHTGDVGAFDAEGYLSLKDRSKDVIISGGSNIYPREVEEVLLEHPLVREVSVIGRPDPDWGEVVVAYIGGTADPAELDRLCLERIARFKRPKDYVLVEALPKNAYGKILKTALREADAARTDKGGGT